MILRKLKIIGLLVLIGASHAQAGEVEVNLDVLEGYRPPPMFDDLRPPLVEPLSSAPQVVIEVIQTALPPKPERKPEHKTELLQKDLVSPTARDVLNQIDGNVTPTKVIPKKSSIETIKATSFVVDSSNKVTIHFLPEISDISEENKRILIEQALIKTARKESARIEIQSFASSKDNNASSARRISLARALEVRSFLIDNNVDSRRIDIRPLGIQANAEFTDRVDIYFVK